MPSQISYKIVFIRVSFTNNLPSFILRAEWKCYNGNLQFTQFWQVPVLQIIILFTAFTIASLYLILTVI